MTEYKACSKCKQVKPLSDFHKSKAAKSGHKPSCQLCKQKANKIYRAENTELIKAINKAWCAKNPRKLKEYALKSSKYYLENPSKRKEYYQKNREKLVARHRQWRANNYEKARQIEKTYRSSNPHVGRLQSQKRRALKKANGCYLVSVKESKRMLQSPCFYCGQPSKHLDHVVPLSRGGSHSIGNLVPSCITCNISKNKKTIMEWRVWRKRVLL